MKYGLTGCPKCGKLVVVLGDDEEKREWQYLCPGADKVCGTAFKFEEKDDEAGS